MVVGRNRREEKRSDLVVVRSGIIHMGKGGLGKPVGFDVARVVKVRTVKEGDLIEFELDYDEMRGSKESNDKGQAG